MQWIPQKQLQKYCSCYNVCWLIGSCQRAVWPTVYMRIIQDGWKKTKNGFCITAGKNHIMDNIWGKNTVVAKDLNILIMIKKILHIINICSMKKLDFTLYNKVFIIGHTFSTIVKLYYTKDLHRSQVHLIPTVIGLHEQFLRIIYLSLS